MMPGGVNWAGAGSGASVKNAAESVTTCANGHKRRPVAAISLTLLLFCPAGQMPIHY
jgi:hypothetical protein